jgi:hypothetical protein
MKNQRVIILALTLIAWTGFGSLQCIADDSDWWSLIRQETAGQEPPSELRCSTPKKERPSGANFVVAGVDLNQGDPIADAEQKIAKPERLIGRGDASSSRTQLCFKSASERGRYKLIFERAEVASVAYLIDGGPTWAGSQKCVESRKVSENLSTRSGLHLGMTAAEVEKILGKPCVASKDAIEYEFSFEHLLTAKERKQIRDEGLDHDYPSEIDLDEPFSWFGTVQIKFRGAKSYYIAILTGDVQ